MMDARVRYNHVTTYNFNSLASCYYSTRSCTPSTCPSTKPAATADIRPNSTASPSIWSSTQLWESVTRVSSSPPQKSGGHTYHRYVIDLWLLLVPLGSGTSHPASLHPQFRDYSAGNLSRDLFTTKRKSEKVL